MLPDPSWIVRIPSIHDGTSIDCRLYHPAHQDRRRRVERCRYAAVLAHPYAPLGGCFDDPVVSVVGRRLLDRGFVLGTFNFRGAGCSAGRTSWTANPERDDYVSFLGFLVHYIRLLQIPRAGEEDNAPSQPPGPDVNPPPLLLLMGGYSYGAMITTQLAPLDKLLDTFSSPEPGSYAAQILTEATRMAGIARLSPDLDAPSSIDPPDHRWRDSTPPVSHISSGPQDKAASRPSPDEQLPPHGPAVPDAAYLLISPPAPRGLVSHLITLSLIPSALTSTFARRPPGDGEARAQAAETKLVQNRTLAVYGGADALVSVGKLHAWAQAMAARRGSLFRGREIQSAGHFWAEDGALSEMVGAVDDFADALQRSRS
ncbi:hypothetical protein ESCO_002293 [Escovopsis weberi]|uniref:Uncharacterized protein n=1 Tax=Escovopsis weberi TaxID=150374 RepID=A0A0M9VWX1_ESCWE|nr:hypothetical protein ESCO_002293 [Escovopsis weberi]